ncbi:MAG: response regulator [Ardenticatenaceae bacterium]|nr:response regulator [Ardenticatenaceae bacterium]
MTIKTILIVDDEKLMRALLRHYCKQNGFEVVEAENGEEALHRLGEKRPDLVMMDAMMPVMNGLVLAHRIRQHFDEDQLPILFLTSEADAQTQKEALAAGAQAYLTKPVSLGDLLNSIKQLTMGRSH